MKSTLQDALSRLTPEQRFAQVMQHGTMSVELYAPDKIDPQQPHAQDELYVVVSGTGQFMNGDEVYPFGPGDVIFVPAGREHRFFDFTDDFQTWVIFYGPDGGETSKS